MRAKRQNRNDHHAPAWIAVSLVAFVLLPAFGADNVIFQLCTGERITGTIISENTNYVIVSNIWAKELSIPLAQVEKRTTNFTSKVAQVTVAPTTNVVVKPPPTNSIATTPPKQSKPKLWHGEVRTGVDFLYNAHNRQIYSGRLKLTYARPYHQNPGKFFRNSIDYLVEYAKTDGLLSANRMDGSDKTDFDVGKKVFAYNVVGAGYDKIRKINLRYEFGPGVGYHLFTFAKFAMNTEAGMNYQVQRRSRGQDVENFYYRLAEDFTWKITPKMTLTEKLEFFPRAEEPNQFRSRFESTLAFALFQNLSFNISVMDLYDTQPAPNVSNNELQVRSSIGVTF